MRPAPDDWHGVAAAKLEAVLGPVKGPLALADALRATRLERIATAGELYRVAQQLSETGGFAGAVGGLLGVHAVMHGGNDVREGFGESA
jgi:hypothetical protein